jgi:hypothetical protein
MSEFDMKFKFVFFGIEKDYSLVLHNQLANIEVESAAGRMSIENISFG